MSPPGGTVVHYTEGEDVILNCSNNNSALSIGFGNYYEWFSEGLLNPIAIYNSIPGPVKLVNANVSESGNYLCIISVPQLKIMQLGLDGPPITVIISESKWFNLQSTTIY